MNMRAIAGLSLSALMLGGTMVACSQGGIATASSRDASAAAKNAAKNAEKANKALAKGDAKKAIGFAEAAVALMPQNTDYRSLLAGAYLKAGRFTSAHAAYADLLQLTPGNGKAALNLALAMIAEGQWDEARQTLEAHASVVPAGDRGLAVALAGDPATGVELLTAAARSPDADAKTRQNLALALALAGRWVEAREVVGIDLAPTDADARMVQWAAFAKPVGAADQVAALLGVMPVKDPGRPVALALNAAVPVAAMAAAEPVEAPVATSEPVAAPEAVAAVEAPPSSGAARIVFAERREVVQALPTRTPATFAAPRTVKTQLATASAEPKPVAQPNKGKWFVQLGAYDNAAVAKDAWGRAQRRYPAFEQQTPTGMAFKSFYRLSVGGFAKADADALCRGYRAKGGACFVRTGAGDQVAQWVKPAGVQVASR
ncbi:tetratricopeptide repeat protein [uncultured Sphingomonas sp.]|uniref:SPOR domain-containing protein n=1 Tax=uncultured Sphingomonas sp. TaxID=158754 RepID=UPI0025EF77C6|nr:tetratricopeptide repeat protein [uncultured Sphingomonas sp.]